MLEKITKILNNENKNIPINKMNFLYQKFGSDEVKDKKEVAFGKINQMFKKAEMLDDNGTRPEILNGFKKLKIKGDLHKMMLMQHKQVMMNI